MAEIADEVVRIPNLELAPSEKETGADSSRMEREPKAINLAKLQLDVG
jgi:hypothetical protein